jgi:hypothetical protein
VADVSLITIKLTDFTDEHRKDTKNLCQSASSVRTCIEEIQTNERNAQRGFFGATRFVVSFLRGQHKSSLIHN